MINNTPSIGKFSISFEVGLFAILLIPSILVIIYFLFVPAQRIELIFVISVIGGIAAIYSAFYAGENLKRTYEYNKKSKTFEMIQRFDQIEYAEMYAFLDTDFDIKDMKQNEVYEKIISDSGLFLAVRSVMNLCEDISIAVQGHYIDEKIAFLSLEQVFRMYVNKFKPYIEGHREKYGTNLIYNECEKLAYSWSNNQYLTSGKKIEE